MTYNTLSYIDHHRGHLYRNVHMQHLYEENKHKILQHYQTMEDYIKYKFLKFSRKRTATGLYATYPNPNIRQYVMVKNSFPYNLNPSIHHHVLFSLRPLTNAEQKNIINQHLPSNIAYTFYTNPKKSQSIKHLWHSHIFWKENDSDRKI